MIQGKFAFANIRSATVAGSELLRFAENAIPTRENRRSTVADVAGACAGGSECGEPESGGGS